MLAGLVKQALHWIQGDALMFHVAIKTSLVTGLCALTLIALPTLASAQQQTFNAAGQARAKMQKSHSRTGMVGGGYRPWSVWSYQKSARVHAQVLNAYGQNCKQVPPEIVKEHLGQVRKDIVAAKAEVKKFGADAAKEADVKKHLDALEKQLTECEQLCGMMEKTIGQDGVETTQFCAHCSDLETKLKAAELEHTELLKKLGIKLPVPKSDHVDHEKQK
ncbi:hypothetical protein [Planctomicrobium sp. SH527]|uniref:hypothetical protein n=1 Tax=Planctomicrobium sp. SH527 TaxID=3448123 RepID=UPI003F5C6D3E